jgi:hypothetical protein
MDLFGYFHAVGRELRPQATPTLMKRGEAQKRLGRTDGMLSLQGGRRPEGVGRLFAETDRHDRGKLRTDENRVIGHSRAPPSSLDRSSAPTANDDQRRTVSAGSRRERDWRIDSNKTREVTQRLSLTYPERLKANAGRSTDIDVGHQVLGYHEDQRAD